MSPFFNDWYACFIQITTIWYIMTFISNPRILTSRSRLTHTKVWEKFGSFRFLPNCRDSTLYVSHVQNKNFKTWLKEGGQCTKRENSLSWLKADGWTGSHTNPSKGVFTNQNVTQIMNLTKFIMWRNITHYKYYHLFQVKERYMETLIWGKETD